MFSSYHAARNALVAAVTAQVRWDLLLAESPLCRKCNCSEGKGVWSLVDLLKMKQGM